MPFKSEKQRRWYYANDKHFYDDYTEKGEQKHEKHEDEIKPKQSFDIMISKNVSHLKDEREDDKSLTVDEIRNKFIVGSREYKKGRR